MGVEKQSWVKVWGPSLLEACSDLCYMVWFPQLHDLRGVDSNPHFLTSVALTLGPPVLSLLPTHHHHLSTPPGYVLGDNQAKGKPG